MSHVVVGNALKILLIGYLCIKLSEVKAKGSIGLQFDESWSNHSSF